MPITIETVFAFAVVVGLIYRTISLIRVRRDWNAQARSVLFVGGLWVLVIGFWYSRW